MDEEIKELFDGLKKIKKADEAIKKIALQKQISWGDAVRNYFVASGFAISFSQLEKIELRNAIETLEYIENIIREDSYGSSPKTEI